MPTLVYVAQRWLPRDYGVHLVLDIAAAAPFNWGVLSTYKAVVFSGVTEMSYADAAGLADDQALLFGPEGDSSWKAVLARLTNKVPAPTPWQGSPAEVASRYAAIGSWNWIAHLARNRVHNTLVTAKGVKS